ncbi:hypothetical protein AUR64_06125 [Haloprofundus marisrubri]|uniref:Methyltransferase type 11 domain-containing protein n=1 Tax=Haloprofundus marisrubri TaxID=1514971 RepID=A0A0W1RDR4_9EURY|nr:class I SAM-dependent methyltransferase [Haloprofundus marisrubri]KTG10765.1 hypothetical protein AUR64_06125 [Haloprofundus marisrubri]
MPDWTDPDTLAEQYADASNLDARVALHRDYSTAEQDLHEWLFDQFEFSSGARVLSLGAGPAHIWRKNVGRVPEIDVFVTDFSGGMVREARSALPEDGRFRFAQVDAASIPFAADSFDVVTANHMLYHVADREHAISEIARILRPDGVFYAATNGESNLEELHSVVEKHHGGDSPFRVSSRFTLENGGAQIRERFETVEVRRHDNSLRVTAAEPVVAYALSGNIVESENAEAFARLVESRMDGGVFDIAKDVGLFVARNPV